MYCVVDFNFFLLVAVKRGDEVAGVIDSSRFGTFCNLGIFFL